MPSSRAGSDAGTEPSVALAVEKQGEPAFFSQAQEGLPFFRFTHTWQIEPCSIWAYPSEFGGFPPEFSLSACSLR